MTRGFTRVPNTLVCGEVRRPDGRRLGVGPQALYLLVLHYSRCGERTCTASQSTLAERLGVKVRTVHSWLLELEQSELVEVRRRGYGRTNAILPLLVPDRQQSADSGRKRSTDKEDAQGEEDNSSVQGDPVVVPLRKDRAS
jgi:DNA-binding MarR family transcriptional regulator